MENYESLIGMVDPGSLVMGQNRVANTTGLSILVMQKALIMENSRYKRLRLNVSNPRARHCSNYIDCLKCSLDDCTNLVSGETGFEPLPMKENLDSISLVLRCIEI